MYYMIKIFKNLLGLFKKAKKEQDQKSETHTASISFSFDDKNYTNIEFAFPHVVEVDGYYDDNDLVKQSELYAQMLILINSGSYRQAVINGLKKAANNDNDINHNNKLLASNILSFFLVLEKASISYTANTQKIPKIRPTEVFKMPL